MLSKPANPHPKQQTMLHSYLTCRARTEALCAPLLVEDCVLQAMEDVSPPKWHLGHTSWFFEEFVLKPYYANYIPFREGFSSIFNSYYESLNRPLARSQRGMLSRPSLQEVYDYRHAIDEMLGELWEQRYDLADQERKEIESRIVLGIEHEKQHQELLLTDIKYNFYKHPLQPAYHNRKAFSLCPSIPLSFLEIKGGIRSIGFQTKEGSLPSEKHFCYDNERPRHKVYCRDFAIASRPVNCGEYLAFIESGGYRDFRYWFADAWQYVQAEKWEAPLYWSKQEGGAWMIFSLAGFLPLLEDEPVAHLSYYEAAAYAAWAAKRLPTEIEWEIAASHAKLAQKNAHWAHKGYLHPLAPAYASQEKSSLAQEKKEGLQWLGNLWEWTTSAYAPYPGYRAWEGALGEYNEKFMTNQMVLRGGSCLSPAYHIRTSYRNFLHPYKQWQCSGLRLAEDL